jgi:hypothetical protein
LVDEVVIPTPYLEPNVPIEKGYVLQKIFWYLIRMLKNSSTGAYHVQVCTADWSRAGRLPKAAPRRGRAMNKLAVFRPACRAAVLRLAKPYARPESQEDAPHAPCFTDQLDSRACLATRNNKEFFHHPAIGIIPAPQATLAGIMGELAAAAAYDPPFLRAEGPVRRNAGGAASSRDGIICGREVCFAKAHSRAIDSRERGQALGRG